METLARQLIGVGLYTIPEAARLTGVPAPTVRRWAFGYKQSKGGAQRTHEAIWKSQLPRIDGKAALCFLDLVEIRVIQALLHDGQSWKQVRRIGDGAAKLFRTERPFSSLKFKTDGVRIYNELSQANGDAALVEPATFQIAMREVIKPFLHDLDYGESGEATRWWPKGNGRWAVVIDPARCFGRPIISGSGVPTAVLKAAFDAEGQDAATVARWYEMPKAAVLKAVEFERQLAA